MIRNKNFEPNTLTLESNQWIQKEAEREFQVPLFSASRLPILLSADSPKLGF